MPYQQQLLSHAQCAVCCPVGKNSSSLGLIFHAESEHLVFSQFKVLSQHQGYNGLLHGGIAATLADAAMTHCLFYQGVKGLTAELNMRFHHPIELNDLVDIYGELNQVRRHIYQLSSRLIVNDTLCVSAQGKFMQPKPAFFSKKVR